MVGRAVWGACLFLPLFCLDRLAIKLKVLCTHVALQVKSSDGKDKCPHKGGHDHALAHLHTCRSSVAGARERGKATHCRREGGDSHPELLVELALHLDGRLFDKHLVKMSSLSTPQTKADSQSTPVVFGTEGRPARTHQVHTSLQEQQLSPQPQEVHVKASSVRNPSFNLASEPRIWAQPPLPPSIDS